MTPAAGVMDTAAVAFGTCVAMMQAVGRSAGAGEVVVVVVVCLVVCVSGRRGLPLMRELSLSIVQMRSPELHALSTYQPPPPPCHRQQQDGVDDDDDDKAGLAIDNVKTMSTTATTPPTPMTPTTPTTDSDDDTDNNGKTTTTGHENNWT
ncbi:hypothetical protein EDB84DRAFT_1567922 [Lactarius hengduanensis]|nr:hypothetical protein EDB84DRAFT_1567922 [Lactarius hengduanensis]